MYETSYILCLKKICSIKTKCLTCTVLFEFFISPILLLLHQCHLFLYSHWFHQGTTPNIGRLLNYAIEWYLGVIHYHKEHIFYDSP